MIEFATHRRYGVLGYGDPNLDCVFAVERAPRADEKMPARRLGRFAGGTVGNAICAASRLGVRAASRGRVGDDADGRFLAAEFERFGVATEHLQVLADSPSSLAMILVEASGEKALIYAPLDGEQSRDDAELPALCAQSAIVYAMPYAMSEIVRLSRAARTAGAVFAIDLEAAMVVDPGFLDALCASVDLLFVNRTSFREIFGAEPELDALRRLLDRGPQLVVVTCGADGALAATRGESSLAPAYPATLVDATGAGDCFNGAFLAALLDGQKLAAALHFASAAASFSISAVGARSALPTRGQVAARLAAGVRDVLQSTQV